MLLKQLYNYLIEIIYNWQAYITPTIGTTPLVTSNKIDIYHLVIQTNS